ncbi:MAG: recombinase family protein [Candidatus Eisenbacteria bacterium]|nr:recombinase family protein [Candidatus Eisenbacteria bacterium]
MRTKSATSEPTKHVGIWIRVSTEDQARGDSPEHHEKRARLYAESREWKVSEVYHLEAVSGKSVMGHPETERMLGHIRSGHISALIFSKLARLARNTRELLDFADIFRECDADLVSLQESIDTSTPAGRLFYTMIAAMAQWEREEISERVAASIPIRARLGKPIAGAAPFGYQWVDRKLIPHPQEAPVRRLLYELFLEHKRKKAVARILNERGYRTRRGLRFSDTTVERLITDPSAKGVRRANYCRSLGKNKKWVFKPKDEWVLLPIEAVVPVELWEQCNAILEGRRIKGKPPGRTPVYLFAGLVRCHCGQKMYVYTESPKYICKRCRNRIGIDDLEAIFHDQLRAFLLSPEEVAKHLAQSDESLRTKEAIVQTLQGEEQRVRGEMERVYRAYVSDQLTVEGFGRQYKPLEERLRQIEQESPRLQGEIDFMKVQLLSRDEILSGARDLHARWPKLSREEKRQIVEVVVEEIRIGKEEVEIDLAGLPFPRVSSEELATPFQGLLAATRSARAGKLARPLARARWTTPLSSGSRSTSIMRPGYSVISSRNRTP